MDHENELQKGNCIASNSVVYIKEEPSDDIFLYEGDVKKEVFINKKNNEYLKTEPSSSASYLGIQTGADPYLSVLPDVTLKNKRQPNRKVYTIKQSQIRRTTKPVPIPRGPGKKCSLPKEAGTLECVKCEINFPNIELLMKHGAEHINQKYPAKRPPYKSRREYGIDYPNIELLMKRGAENIKQEYPAKGSTSKSRILT